MSKLLIHEHPIQLIPSLAAEIGLNEAIVLQQMHYWVDKSNHTYDGKSWVYNTYENWQEENFPFWSVRTVKRVVKSLREKDLIVTKKINARSGDQTNWYSINYEELRAVEDRMTRCPDPESDNVESPSGQDGTIPQSDNVSRSINKDTETTTETNNRERERARENPDKEPRAVAMYRKTFRDYSPTCMQADRIAQVVGEDHLDVWDDVLDRWLLNEHNPANIKDMCAAYKERLPEIKENPADREEYWYE